MKITIQRAETITTEVTPELLGQLFASMDDDEQARFFVAAAAEAKSWPVKNWSMQFYLAGSHLKNCECSSEDGRELVRALASGLEEGKH